MTQALRSFNLPIPSESVSASIVATASATPVPERDATVNDAMATPVMKPATLEPPALAPPPAEKEDLNNANWYYRDPEGNEQGTFILNCFEAVLTLYRTLPWLSNA
jgi:PERQ amino acid-rich with GYF domain-containing protein